MLAMTIFLENCHGTQRSRKNVGHDNFSESKNVGHDNFLEKIVMALKGAKKIANRQLKKSQ